MEEYENLLKDQHTNIAFLETVDAVCGVLCSMKRLQGDNIVIPYGEAVNLAGRLSATARAVGLLMQSTLNEKKEIVDMFHRSDD